MINGLLSVNGGSASTNSDKGNVAVNTDQVNFPTVTEVANQRFTGGFSWLVSNNANASIKILKPGDPTLASEPTIAGITLADVSSKLDSAGFTTSTRSLKNGPKSITKDTSALDVGTLTSPRFAMKPTASSSSVDGRNQKIYFFPPGDYYFTDLELAADACVFLTREGNVRIWVDSNGTGTDDSSKNYYIFTDPTPSKFRLYYNKCSQIKMRGHAYFHGSIYGIRGGCTGSKPELDEAGGDAVFGSVIMNGFTISGGSKVVFPNNGGGLMTILRCGTASKTVGKKSREATTRTTPYSATARITSAPNVVFGLSQLANEPRTARASAVPYGPAKVGPVSSGSANTELGFQTDAFVRASLDNSKQAGGDDERASRVLSVGPILV